jgi:hypothetical protein
MKKISTAAVKRNRNISEQKLTIGFDLGDRSSWYCVLDEARNLDLKINNFPVFFPVSREFSRRRVSARLHALPNLLFAVPAR